MSSLSRFYRVFPRGRTNVLGMIHMGALPGTPRARKPVAQLAEEAAREAEIYTQFGLDGVIVENMNDLPYVKEEDLGPEVTAAATVITREVRQTFPEDKPVGVQILAGGNNEAVAVAIVAGAQFIRAESFVFGHVADEGWMDGCAGKLLRYRKHLGADNDISVFCDIKKKHSSHAITADINLVDTAEAAGFFGAEGIVLTGDKTGAQTNPDDLAAVRNAVPELPVLIGSGVTAKNVEKFADAHALIVGSYFKRDGRWQNELDPKRIEVFMNSVNKIR